MKKKELMKIDPPEFTPYLKRIAKKDGPVKSQYWGADKNYKYGKYLRVKEEKGYLVVSVFLAQFVRAGANFPYSSRISSGMPIARKIRRSSMGNRMPLYTGPEKESVRGCRGAGIQSIWRKSCLRNCCRWKVMIWSFS